MDYLGKGKMLPNREVNTFGHKIGEKLAFLCLWNISGIIYFSSLNMKHCRRAENSAEQFKRAE